MALLLTGDLQRLEAFQMFCLRRILRISWMDHVNNTIVRERCQQPSMEALLRQKRLRWLGHVQRMDIQVRLPKQLLWGRLSEGMRRQGGHKKRWIDVCMQDLKDCGVLCSWKDTCLNRHEWANIIRAEVGITKKETLRQQKRPNDALNIDSDVVDGVGLSVPESDMPNDTLMCPVCNRVFSRERDRKRHRCTSVRSKAALLRRRTSNSNAVYQGTPITEGGIGSGKNDDGNHSGGGGGNGGGGGCASAGGGGGGGFSGGGGGVGDVGYGGVGKVGLDRSIVCQTCSRSFSRPSDLKRHSCDSVRSKKFSIRGR